MELVKSCCETPCACIFGFHVHTFMPPDLKGRTIPLLMKTALTCCSSGYKYCHIRPRHKKSKF